MFSNYIKIYRKGIEIKDVEDNGNDDTKLLPRYINM